MLKNLIISLSLSFAYVGSNNATLSLSTFDSICAALSLSQMELFLVNYVALFYVLWLYFMCKRWWYRPLCVGSGRRSLKRMQRCAPQVLVRAVKTQRQCELLLGNFVQRRHWLQYGFCYYYGGHAKSVSNDIKIDPKSCQKTFPEAMRASRGPRRIQNVFRDPLGSHVSQFLPPLGSPWGSSGSLWGDLFETFLLPGGDQNPKMNVF